MTRLEDLLLDDILTASTNLAAIESQVQLVKLRQLNLVDLPDECVAFFYYVGFPWDACDNLECEHRVREVGQ